MAFVPGYKHDIFVSYAHVDDISISSSQRGWVTELVKNLEYLLVRQIGRADAYSIWMDYQLAGNRPFTDALVENVRQSATLLIVLSPGYLTSEWCRKEQNEFLEAIKSRQYNRSRIFIVETQSMDAERRPTALADLLGYRFWAKGETDHDRMLGWPSPNREDTEYWDIIERLASDLVATLKNIAQTEAESKYKDTTKAEPARPDPVQPTEETFDLPPDIVEILERKIESNNYDVFLCHNTSDKPNVKIIGRQLMENKVLPWLDEWDLRPGLPWQEALESQIENIKAAAVFVGESGFGPWQNMELSAILRQFVIKKCPVIPVVLEECSQVPQLPVFLAGMHWVDFRNAKPDPMQQLLWGITFRRSRIFSRT